MSLRSTLKSGYERLVLAAAARLRRPLDGRLVNAMREDTDRSYVSIGLTPAKLTTLIKAFDGGDLASGLELCEEMEEKDLHLYSVANTRRLALTGLPWEVVSAADVDELSDRGLADAAADYCRERLRGIESLDGTLKHLSQAIGRNLAVAEIVWAKGELADVVPVPSGRLVFDTAAEPPVMRVLTAENKSRGIEMVPAKWIVHMPHSVSGIPMFGGLLRATAAAYVAKAFALKDWLIFLEIFGMPVRIARYEPTATPDEKAELLEMLQNLGADAAGIFSKAVELEIKEAAQKTGELPYERCAAFFNAELSKAWLGQTLTTEAGDRGARSLGEVHDEVRSDLLEDDIAGEGVTIRRDLLQPMVAFAFGPEAPVPYFRRRQQESRDTRELSDSVKAAVDLGLMVDASWFATELGVVTTENEEEALTKPAPLPSPFGGQALPLKEQLRVTSHESRVRKPSSHMTHHSSLVTRHSTLVLSDDVDWAEEFATEAAAGARILYSPIVATVLAWLDELIAAGGAIDQVEQLLAERIEMMPEAAVEALAEAIADVSLAALLRGRVAMQDRIERHRLETGATQQVAFAETVFTPLPFRQAIDAMRDRLELTREEFDQLERDAKSRAFTVAWVDSVRLLADIHAAMTASLETGETLHEFRRRLPDMLAQHGWYGERPWHADLVFRQQAMMASQAGRYQQMTGAGVTHWRYSALGDSRTRPEHAALDGRVFAMSDRRYYPPWDFGCRCVAEPVFDDELAGETISDSRSLAGRQIGSNPETGEAIRLPDRAASFEWDPAAFAGIKTVNLDSVPGPLREAFERLLNARGIRGRSEK